LLDLGDADTRMSRVMVTVGCISAVFLVLYTVFLGSKGDFYNLMRRFGVTIYFSFSYLAQLMQLGRLMQIRKQGEVRLPVFVIRGKLVLVITLLVLGLASIPIGNFVADKDKPVNAIEWTFSLLMASYYFFSCYAWKYSGFSFSTSANRRPDN